MRTSRYLRKVLGVLLQAPDRTFNEGWEREALESWFEDRLPSPLPERLRPGSSHGAPLNVPPGVLLASPRSREFPMNSSGI